MTQTNENVPVVLTVAGTDPCGGAGINVDLQVFRDRRCHGVSAITAVVWQNTQGVGGWHALKSRELRAQLDAVTDDFDVRAVKIGMLPTAELMAEVAAFIEMLDEDVSVIFDPVMMGGTGDRALMDESAKVAIDTLARRVDLVTPNASEAETMVRASIRDLGPMEITAALLEAGWRRVLLKGGHLRVDDEAPVVDWYGDKRGVKALAGMDPVKDDVRGTGCQLSSAIAAERAHGNSWDESVAAAREYLHRLLVDQACFIGRGRPVVVRVEQDS